MDAYEAFADLDLKIYERAQNKLSTYESDLDDEMDPSSWYSLGFSDGIRSSRFHAIADRFPPRGVWLEFYDGKKTMGDTPPFNHIDKLGEHDCKVNYLHNYTHWRKLSQPD